MEVEADVRDLFHAGSFAQISQIQLQLALCFLLINQVHDHLFAVERNLLLEVLLECCNDKIKYYIIIVNLGKFEPATKTFFYPKEMSIY